MPKKTTLKAIDSLTWEEAINRVEVLIEEIESGSMSLEDQIEAYSTGSKLLSRAKAILAQCEQRVEEITLSLENADEEQTDEASNTD